MAYVKVGTTKTVNALIRYCENEKAENRTKGESIKERDGLVKGGVNCDPNFAKEQFKACRIMWEQDKGLQGHAIIQSFDGTEVSAEKANQIGCELAKQIAAGHQAVVFTHTDSAGGNVHNHIIINAVNIENGKKFDSHAVLYKARGINDELCRQHGLSIIEEQNRAKIRFHQAEQALLNKGIQSWKDELREVIDFAKKNSANLAEFKQNLAESGVNVSERTTKNATTWTYQHSNGKKCRAWKLGEDYTKSSIQSELNKNRELGKSMQSRENILKKGFENIKNTLEAEKAKEKASLGTGFTMNDLAKEEISAMALRGNDYTAQMARAKLERKAVLSRV